jgi:hypothetical protein
VGAAVAARDMPADRQLAGSVGGPCPGGGWHCPWVLERAVQAPAAGGAGGGGGWRRVRPGPRLHPTHVACPDVPCPERCGFDAVVRWVRSGLPHALPRARAACVPAGDWFCPECAAAAALPPVPARPAAPHRRPSASYDRMAKLSSCCVTPVMGAFTCAALGCVGGVRLSAIGSARAALAHILPLLATRAAARGPMAVARRPCTIPIIMQHGCSAAGPARPRACTKQRLHRPLCTCPSLASPV